MTLMVQGRDRSDADDRRCRLCGTGEAQSHLITVQTASRRYYVCEGCMAELEASARAKRLAG